MKTYIVHCRLDAETYDHLVMRAMRKGLTLSAVVRLAIRQYLERGVGEEEGEAKPGSEAGGFVITWA